MLLRISSAVAGVTATVAALVLVPTTAQAAAPALELPFICGTSWVGNSGASSAHRNNEIDWNMSGTSGNEDLGEPVLAAAAGTVSAEGGETSAYGNYLEIDHGGGYSTLYAHLDKKSVHDGDTVRQGQVIGTVGNTDGNTSGLSAHLHFEFRNRGSGQSYPDYIRPASFHGDPFDYAGGTETYVSQNCGTVNRAAKSVNGDRYDDAVGIDPSGNAWLYKGRAGGGFDAAVQIGTGWNDFSRIAVNDSNADGWADLFAIRDGSLHYWNNRGDGTFAVARVIGPGWNAYEYVSFVDINGDNKTDVLARDGGKMYVYTGQGSGAFSARSLLGEGWSGYARHTGGDADADGDGDIWATNGSGELFFWRKDSGGYATGEQVGSGWNGFRQVVSMDVNGDAKADLVAIRTSDNTLWQWLGGGAGRFGRATQIGHGWSGFDLAVN
ncbi:VCBS repeat domain-containing M23 family metallopeptidase [Lentzea sp. NPDC042327]|uniref:VCBS repeat domain-containing M23 family metallopeptidase n=1 Tax=Lentzea sp. NPDC042327 TaxID=3154801 RepID=UPI0033E85739